MNCASRMATRLHGRSYTGSFPVFVMSLYIEPLDDLDRPGGPGGKRARADLKGRSVATPESDLEISLYAERPWTADKEKVSEPARWEVPLPLSSCPALIFAAGPRPRAGSCATPLHARIRLASRANPHAHTARRLCSAAIVDTDMASRGLFFVHGVPRRPWNWAQCACCTRCRIILLKSTCPHRK